MIVLFLVLSSLEWRLVSATFALIHWSRLSLAFIIFMASYLIRTWRFLSLINTRNMYFNDLFPIVSLHGTLNYLLPAKTGELSYIMLLYRRLNVSLAESAATLLVARFFDFAIISLFLPIMLLAYRNRLPDELIIAVSVFIGFVLLFALALFIFIRRRSPSQDKGTDTAKSIPQKITVLVGELQNSLSAIFQQGAQFKLFLSTALIWICVFSYLYLIVLSLNYDANYLQFVVISIFMIPMELLPLQGFANLGTHELAWVTAYTLFNRSPDEALNIAISSHVILVGFVLLLGLISLGITTLFNYISPQSRD